MWHSAHGAPPNSVVDRILLVRIVLEVALHVSVQLLVQPLGAVRFLASLDFALLIGSPWRLGRPHQAERLGWIHWRVSVKGRAVARANGGADGHQPLGARRPEDRISQLRPVVVNVVDVKARRDSEPCSAFEVGPA